MHNVSASPIESIGIVEMNEAGSAYRVVWGLMNRKPTSELPTHIMNHAIRMKATDGACRVIYHAHPNNIIAMTFVEPLDARTFSRALWKAMTECVVVFPEGVGVVPWMVPGGQRDREGHVGADEELSCGHLGAARSVRFRRRFR